MFGLNVGPKSPAEVSSKLHSGSKEILSTFELLCVCVWQESREQALESQLVAARWSSLLGALEEAEKIIQDSLSQIDEPAHISCTSSAGQNITPTHTCMFCSFLFTLFGTLSNMPVR